LRNRKKLSQEKLAELVGISRQAISKWENDLSYPDIENLIKLSEVFSISVDELLNLNTAEKKDVEGEVRKSNDGFNREKIYFYNETLTKSISYIVLVLLLPLNVYFYNNGVYGEIYIELRLLGKGFLRNSLYDIPFIIIMGGFLIKFMKDIKNKKKTMVVINKEDKITGFLLFFVISLVIILIYFKLPEFSSIALFLGMIPLVYISAFETIMELTKKELKWWKDWKY